jgi:FKBP-type peptidyl-prolyl cis-trans isomerase FklB
MGGYTMSTTTSTTNKNTSLETPEEKVSYGIGLQMGQQLRENPFEGLDIEGVIVGLRDSFAWQEARVSNEHLSAAFQIVSAKQEALAAEQGEKFSREGRIFLEKNAKRPDVIQTPSGLQYEILIEGNGPKPNARSTVRVHYHGTLIDSTVFDSSVERDEPAEFPVNGVISGWTEALQLMPVGSKWRIFLPHELAYGDQGAGGAIEPYSALIFEVELLAIV